MVNNEQWRYHEGRRIKDSDLASTRSLLWADIKTAAPVAAFLSMVAFTPPPELKTICTAKVPLSVDGLKLCMNVPPTAMDNAMTAVRNHFLTQPMLDSIHKLAPIVAGSTSDTPPANTGGVDIVSVLGYGCLGLVGVVGGLAGTGALIFKGIPALIRHAQAERTAESDRKARHADLIQEDVMDMKEERTRLMRVGSEMGLKENLLYGPLEKLRTRVAIMSEVDAKRWGEHNDQGH